MPSEVSTRVTGFDKFAGYASKLASRAWFFAFCVLLVIIWAPSLLLLKSIDTTQLIINTVTTNVTFLMVALLQNSQTRADQAVQHKLNAIADALADLMEHVAQDTQADDRKADLQHDMMELQDAVGLENRESSSNNRRKPQSSGASPR
jgi:hypothetical protein